MKKVFYTSLLATVICLALMPVAVFAQEGSLSIAKVDYYSWATIIGGIAMAIASSFAALGQGLAISKAVEGISRQPSASGQIQMNLIIGLALIESLAIYTFVICLIIFFAKPFTPIIDAIH